MAWQQHLAESVLNDFNKTVKNSCKRNKNWWIETRCQEAEDAAAKNNSKSLYKIVRDLIRSRSNTSIPVKEKAGTILLSQEEQNAGLVEHFSEILNQSILTISLDLDDDINNVTDDADISINISREEIEEDLAMSRSLPYATLLKNH